MGMLYAAIDIHKHVFQAAAVDRVSGEVVDSRSPATREALAGWAEEWDGRLAAAAIQATCGWHRVARGLQAHRVEVRLAEPAQARALKGKKRQAKTDKLDASWLAMAGGPFRRTGLPGFRHRGGRGPIKRDAPPTCAGSRSCRAARARPDPA